MEKMHLYLEDLTLPLEDFKSKPKLVEAREELTRTSLIDLSKIDMKINGK